MLTNQLKKLAAARAHAAALEQQYATQLRRELAALPAQYGFKSADDFIAALRSAAGGRRGRKPGRPPGGGGTGKRFRARITDETRSEVKALVQAGKTGAEIAKSLKISLPSVQNIKKALGLVKARK